jgi:hypothetical protein
MPENETAMPKSPRLPATLIVVPANDPGLYEYLAASMRPVPDVEVILDRRRPRPAESQAATEQVTGVNRRTGRPPASAFQCLVVRRPSPAAEAAHAALADDAATSDAPTEASRTLLWPALRLRDVLPEVTSGQAAAPRRPSPRPV